MSRTSASGCASSGTASTRKRCASTSRCRGTLDWLLAVISRLYGLRFERARVPVWHDDVLYYDVLDAGDRRVHRRHLSRSLSARGQVHARRGVAGARREPARGPDADHRARHELRSLRPDPRRGGDVLPRVRPRAARRAVGDRTTTSTPARTSSATSSRRRRRSSRSGRAGSRASRRSREFCPDAPVMDAALVERLNAARRFGQGIQYARQHLYAVFDMALYGESPAARWHVGRDGARRRRSATAGHGVPRHVRAHRRRLRGRATTATCGRR